MQKNLFIRGGINIFLLIPLWFWDCDTTALTFGLVSLNINDDSSFMSHKTSSLRVSVPRAIVILT